MFNSGPRFLCPLTCKDTPLAHDIVHVFAMSRRNSHVEMCAAACGCMKHTWSNNGQTKERAERETGELQVTSKIKIMRTSQHPWGYVWLHPFATDWGSLLKWLQRPASISSPMAVRLYSVSPIRAGSSILTSIDFLSSSIWKSMAHMPRGDTATKLDYLSS